jgi:hypothetical protein
MKIKVPLKHFHEVNRTIKSSGVKFLPFRKYDAYYHMEFEPADHPLTTLLLLKYDNIKILD